MNCVSTASPCQGAAGHRSHATSRPGVSVQVGLESWRYYQLWALEAWYFGDTTKLLLHIKSQCRYIHIHFLKNAFFILTHSFWTFQSYCLRDYCAYTFLLFYNRYQYSKVLQQKCSRCWSQFSTHSTALAWLVWCGELGCVVLCSAADDPSVSQLVFTINLRWVNTCVA